MFRQIIVQFQNFSKGYWNSLPIVASIPRMRSRAHSTDAKKSAWSVRKSHSSPIAAAISVIHKMNGFHLMQSLGDLYLLQGRNLSLRINRILDRTRKSSHIRIVHQTPLGHELLHLSAKAKIHAVHQLGIIHPNFSSVYDPALYI